MTPLQNNLVEEKENLVDHGLKFKVIDEQYNFPVKGCFYLLTKKDGTEYSGFTEMVNKALKDQIDSINIIEATRDMFLINENAGPLTINREMFIKVFNQDFHPEMVNIMKEQRV